MVIFTPAKPEQTFFCVQKEVGGAPGDEGRVRSDFVLAVDAGTVARMVESDGSQILLLMDLPDLRNTITELREQANNRPSGETSFLRGLFRKEPNTAEEKLYWVHGFDAKGMDKQVVVDAENQKSAFAAALIKSPDFIPVHALELKELERLEAEMEGARAGRVPALKPSSAQSEDDEMDDRLQTFLRMRRSEKKKNGVDFA